MMNSSNYWCNKTFVNLINIQGISFSLSLLPVVDGVYGDGDPLQGRVQVIGRQLELLGRHGHPSLEIWNRQCTRQLL